MLKISFVLKWVSHQSRGKWLITQPKEKLFKKFVFISKSSRCFLLWRLHKSKYDIGKLLNLIERWHYWLKFAFFRFSFHILILKSREFKLIVYALKDKEKVVNQKGIDWIFEVVVRSFLPYKLSFWVVLLVYWYFEGIVGLCLIDGEVLKVNSRVFDKNWSDFLEKHVLKLNWSFSSEF